MEMSRRTERSELLELRFKNDRKHFYRNTHNIPCQAGEAVVVEGTPGLDVGIVSLAGELVRAQMKKKGIGADPKEVKRLFRRKMCYLYEGSVGASPVPLGIERVKAMIAMNERGERPEKLKDAPTLKNRPGTGAPDLLAQEGTDRSVKEEGRKEKGKGRKAIKR